MAQISDVTIANLGLTAIGARPITSLEDDNTEAQLALIHYAPARDAVLEAREWTFAVKRATLPYLAEAPDWGYARQFQLPPDTLRVLDVRDQQPSHINYNELANRLDWRREGSTIVADSSMIRIRYIARIEDPVLYSPSFVQCLGARLGYELSLSITQSDKMQENMAKLYEAKLAQAAANDGMQGRSQVVRSSKLTGVRGIGASINGFASGVV